MPNVSSVDCLCPSWFSSNQAIPAIVYSFSGSSGGVTGKFGSSGSSGSVGFSGSVGSSGSSFGTMICVMVFDVFSLIYSPVTVALFSTFVF